MALGVEEQERIAETRHIIESNEFLVMYTDGVTEEFSPAGEMFGEPHLRQVIEEAIRGYATVHPGSTPDARTVLEAIDRAVVEFIGDDTPSDDLTLLVLKRLHENDDSHKR